jgi:hypothetical protein
MTQRYRYLSASIRPPQPVGQTLRKLAGWAIASSLGAAHGCGTSIEDWTPIECDPGSNVLRNAAFARPVDFFALYKDYNSIPLPGDTRVIDVYEVGHWGEPCADASDPTACADALEAASQVRDACRTNMQCGPFAVANVDDEVSRIEKREELLAWLGPIDTPDDALTVSAWDGKTIQCPPTYASKETGTRFIRAGDQYLFGIEYDNCGVNLQRERWSVNRDGTATATNIEVLGPSGCAVGRRPEGLRAIEPHCAAGTLGRYFAQIAHLEAASVFAFERLARELTRFAAPQHLIARAAESALDEVRHARLMHVVAQRFGGERHQVEVGPLPTRSLYAIAYENAIEGCIHETFGALVAHHQAACATDPELRAVMQQIARDETRHAELSWHIASWVSGQLSSPQRAAIRLAQRDALLALERTQAQPQLPPSAASLVGLPSPSVASGLVRQLARIAV